MPPSLICRVCWMYCSGLVASLALLDVLGWPHLTAMLAGALMLGDD